MLPTQACAYTHRHRPGTGASHAGCAGKRDEATGGGATRAIDAAIVNGGGATRAIGGGATRGIGGGATRAIAGGATRGMGATSVA